jgi:hypothetical protein
MMRSLLFLAAVTGACLVAGCSATKESPDELDDPVVAGRAANPDGVAYPTDNVGGQQRAGGRPGQRIPNFTFQAYVDGDRAAGLKTISLADFYDPGLKRFKIIDLQVAATWCSVCSSVINATVPVKEKLSAEGVVFLEVVVAGNNPSAGPSLGELDAWIAHHGMNYTTAVDARGQRLGAIGIDPKAVPYDVLVDARTMEILDSSVGAPQSFDVESYVRDGLAYVASHAPSY